MEPNVIAASIGVGLASFLATFLASRSSKKAERELTRDEGENGDATIRRTLREIQEDVRGTRDLAARVDGRFDTLDRKVDSLGHRVRSLEDVTGMRRGMR